MKLKLDSHDLGVWDLYAAHALAGVLSDPSFQPVEGQSWAGAAAHHADKLFSERCKREEAGSIEIDND